MKTTVVFLVVCLGISVGACSAMADGSGRYQAILLQTGSGFAGLSSVLIVDTLEGHMWLWHQELTAPPPKTRGESVKAETFLNYQGRVRPGKKMGELLEKW
jgi:hypothetical protein